MAVLRHWAAVTVGETQEPGQEYQESPCTEDGWWPDTMRGIDTCSLCQSSHRRQAARAVATQTLLFSITHHCQQDASRALGRNTGKGSTAILGFLIWQLKAGGPLQQNASDSFTQKMSSF